MNGVLNRNQLTVVKEYEFDKPLIHKMDPIVDNCYRDCLKKNFHTFKYDSFYDTNLTNITNNEFFNLKIADQSMNLYDLNKKLEIDWQRGFISNQINKLTKKFFTSTIYEYMLLSKTSNTNNAPTIF